MPKRTRSEFEDEEEKTHSARVSPAGNEPILSHAAKRADRKRQKKTEAATDVPPKPARGFPVWVGNLNWKTRPEGIKAFFADVGEPTRVHLPSKALHGSVASKSFANRGFAYVDFQTEAEQTAAISMSEQHLDGRKLLIKNGRDFTGRPGTEGQEPPQMLKAPLTGLTKTAKKILSTQKHPECTSLFIGNLGFVATEDSLINLFARHMKPTHDSKVLLDKEKWLHKVRMGTFEDSGKCKGWAFVDFTRAEYATMALTNPRNHSLDGRALVVEYASPDAVRRGGLGHTSLGGSNEEPSTTKAKGSNRRPPKAERIADKAAKSGIRTAAADAGVESPASEEIQKEEHASSSSSTLPRHKHRPSPHSTRKARREKPGAALASALRESSAIVASTGKKIIF